MRAYIGPSISGRTYDITKSGLWQAIEAQANRHPDVVPTLQRHYDGRYFDLRGAIAHQLTAIGILSEHIEVFDECTADADSRFFSNYAAIQSGRTRGGFASVIWTD
ncbi:MAG: laccase domain-containing protein [Gammaproteobacteria bacterium]